MSAHPGLVFARSIKPGRSCFGLVELGLVIDPGWRNPTFVQRAPGDAGHSKSNHKITIEQAYNCQREYKKGGKNSATRKKK